MSFENIEEIQMKMHQFEKLSKRCFELSGASGWIKALEVLLVMYEQEQKNICLYCVIYNCRRNTKDQNESI